VQVKVVEQESSETFYISAIYSESKEHKKVNFWDSLKLKEWDNHIIVGDFNLCTKPIHSHPHKQYSSQAIKAFKDFKSFVLSIIREYH